ncbi:alpha/beta hydrolase [Streptosporangium sp. NPDC000396]|uniref:alpha/beta hydrolase n=1 Tax=Streptosporangium sp. NPDC000396 TaxID=3366185 RepID=UPI00367DC878
MAANTAAELEAVLSRVVRLAEGHVQLLDPCMRCMAAHAWVGGGAPAFTSTLAARRTTMQQAFRSAAELIAQRIRQLGGQAHAPSFSTSISVMAASPTSFSGMDVAAMNRLVADLQRVGQELPEAGRRLSAELSALCLPASSGRQVADAGVWADEQARDLRRRLTTIQQQHDSGMTNQAMAGFGLFGGHAPDSAGIGKLTAAAGNGDVAALKTLLDIQRTGKDKTLAARLNVWWRQLGPAAQDRLIAASPNLVGSLNGLPATTQDQANRKYLTTQKAAITAELERLRKSWAETQERLKQSRQNLIVNPNVRRTAVPEDPTELYRSMGKTNETIKELELKMRQIEAVEKGLALGGQNGRPPAFLLQLELGGSGKTAVSFGNPDEADNLVAYVPGTGTVLEGFGGDDSKRAAVMWDQANFFQPNKKTASIAWLGYGAPQWDATLSLTRTVVNKNAAEEGAPLLASFVDGLHAAHKAASDARFTVLGHSYGSTVTGLAAQQRPHTFADQLIFVGSPGVGAVKAKDLGVDSVWVGEAPNDPVGDVGSVPLQFTGTLTDDALRLPKVSGALGVDPSAPGFGARQFYVANSGDSLLSFKAHSKYWDDDSASLKNIGYLVTGKYDNLLPFPETPATQMVTPPSPTAPPSPSPRMPYAMPTERPLPHPQFSPIPAGE